MNIELFDNIIITFLSRIAHSTIAHQFIIPHLGKHVSHLFQCEYHA